MKHPQNEEHNDASNVESGAFDPEVIADMTEYAAISIKEGVKDFSKWAKEQIAEFGEEVKPYLRPAWDKAMAVHVERPKEPGPQVPKTANCVKKVDSEPDCEARPASSRDTEDTSLRRKALSALTRFSDGRRSLPVGKLIKKLKQVLKEQFNKNLDTISDADLISAIDEIPLRLDNALNEFILANEEYEKRTGRSLLERRPESGQNHLS